MRSHWYRALFPGTRIDPSKSSQSEFMTTHQGGRLGTSPGGGITGRGGSYIIIDDPHKADDARYDAMRDGTVRWFYESALSRLDDKAKGCIIVIMQRLHEDDLVGHLLRDESYYHLRLPAIAEEDEDIPTGSDSSYHRMEGEALHPERDSVETLEKIKHETGSIIFATQYQQRPSPASLFNKVDTQDDEKKRDHLVTAKYIDSEYQDGVEPREPKHQPRLGPIRAEAVQ